MQSPTASSSPASGSPPPAYRFALVEDQAMLRELLCNELKCLFQPRELAVFDAVKPAFEYCRQSPPDLLLADWRLPDGDGVSLVRQLRALPAAAQMRVVLMTSFPTATLPAELVSLGVSGFVDKSAPVRHIVSAVEHALAGGMYYASAVQPARSATAISAATKSGPPMAELTVREREVARLVANSLSSKEIAQQLDISPRTVEKHRAVAMEKIGVRDTAGLVRWCVENGLV